MILECIFDLTNLKKRTNNYSVVYIIYKCLKTSYL